MPTKGTCKCGAETSDRRHKRCAKCRKEQDSVTPGQRSDYRRDWQLRKKYGITLEDFEAYWFAFRGLCGICARPMKWPEKKRGQSLDVVAVDHDHVTGEVRGLLCNGCNKGLGLFKDSPEILQRAKEYLEK